MPAFLPSLSDDAMAFLGCGAALLASVLTLQLVYFIRNRPRPPQCARQSGRRPTQSIVSDAARFRSLHDRPVYDFRRPDFNQPCDIVPRGYTRTHVLKVCLSDHVLPVFGTPLFTCNTVGSLSACARCEWRIQ